jgi:hypothetical protein
MCKFIYNSFPEYHPSKDDLLPLLVLLILQKLASDVQNCQHTSPCASNACTGRHMPFRANFLHPNTYHFCYWVLRVDSMSPHKKFLDTKILNSIMGEDSNNQELLSKTNTSTNALSTLIKMVGCENPQHIHWSWIAFFFRLLDYLESDSISPYTKFFGIKILHSITRTRFKQPRIALDNKYLHHQCSPRFDQIGRLWKSNTSTDLELHSFLDTMYNCIFL